MPNVQQFSFEWGFFLFVILAKIVHVGATDAISHPEFKRCILNYSLQLTLSKCSWSGYFWAVGPGVHCNCEIFTCTNYLSCHKPTIVVAVTLEIISFAFSEILKWCFNVCKDLLRTHEARCASSIGLQSLYLIPCKGARSIILTTGSYSTWNTNGGLVKTRWGWHDASSICR